MAYYLSSLFALNLLPAQPSEDSHSEDFFIALRADNAISHVVYFIFLSIMDAMPWQEGKMSLILDTYVDIFSSFDPRPYDERSLSDDFLDECRKMVLDKGVDILELRLMIPEAARNLHEEEVIKKRLHAFFITLGHLEAKKRKRETTYAWWFVTIGIILGIIVSYLIHKDAFSQFGTTFITVVGEPASWLLIWTGADKLLQYFWRERDNFTFSQRLSHAKIQFHGY